MGILKCCYDFEGIKIIKFIREVTILLEKLEKSSGVYVRSLFFEYMKI